jgi:hypothetical protein
LEERVALRTVELAEKNKDVIDSINYAKRIQSSLLSPFVATGRVVRDSRSSCISRAT